MYTHILYPTDFSEVAKAPIDHILTLAKATHPRVTVLHVIDPAEVMIGLEPLFFGEMTHAATDAVTRVEQWRESATEEAGRIADQLRAAGLEVACAVEVGDPAATILRVAEAEDVSLIVIGSTGKGHMKELFLGSVSETVVRRSRRPVLVAKAG